jgi:hypothetical protein
VFAKLTDDEVAGLYLYLRTVPPVATVTK